MKSLLRRTVPLAILLASLLFLWESLAANLGDLSFEAVDGAFLVNLSAAAGLAVITFVILGVTAQWIWSDLGSPVGHLAAIETVLVTQIVKYVPGNFLHLVSRAGIAHRYGAQAWHVSLATVYETLWAVVVASMLALPAVLSLSGLLAGGDHGVHIMLWGAIVAGAVVLPFLPRVFVRLLPGIAERIGITEVGMPSWATLAKVFLAYVLIYVLWALSFFVVLAGLVGAELPPLDYGNTLGLVSLALIAGMVVPGLPGGVGVREAILVMGLKGDIGEPTALLAVVFFRAVTVAGDVLCLLAGWAVRHANPQNRRPL